MKKKIFILIPILISVFFVSIASAVLLGNDVEVAEETELIYYLTITYDGVDKNGVESSNTQTSQIVSGYINVEDKLPEGLTFVGFQETEDGSIGAVSRSDGTPCSGYVVDGVDGLKYDEETRLVTFDVHQLQGGCQLTVAIKTMTPTIDNLDTPTIEVRRDFYNVATAKEGPQVVLSNMVHAWMGKENVVLYNVKYEYSGDIPENVSSLPSGMKYPAGAVINVEKDAIAQGYIFSGWSIKSGGISIVNGKITMPSNDVVLTGSFKKITELEPDDPNIPPESIKYNVSYQITSTENPEGYVLPKSKDYYANDTVNIDRLEKGTVYNGYRFSGWSISNSNVEINKESFKMPTQDVVITGSWELVKYKVEYRFMGDILPPNSDSLLPATKYYRPGYTVELVDISDVGSYIFLGWYTKQTFKMPEKDLIIYGEWKIEPGLFRPTITKEIVNKQEYYSFGDVVTYKITVTAPNNIDIYDIYVQENNEKAIFIESSDGSYELMADTIVYIDSLKAGESVILEAQYIASIDDNGEVINEVEIVGALANNNYELDTSIEYKDSDVFIIDSQLEVCNIISGDYDNRILQYHITGVTTDNEAYDTWIVLGNQECQSIYLEPGEYNILEIVPQDYNLSSVTGSIIENNTSFSTGLGEYHKVTFYNDYEKKGFYHSFGRVVNIIKYEFASDVPSEEGDPA